MMNKLKIDLFASAQLLQLFLYFINDSALPAARIFSFGKLFVSLLFILFFDGELFLSLLDGIFVFLDLLFAFNHQLLSRTEPCSDILNTGFGSIDIPLQVLSLVFYILVFELCIVVAILCNSAFILQFL